VQDRSLFRRRKELELGDQFHVVNYTAPALKQAKASGAPPTAKAGGVPRLKARHSDGRRQAPVEAGHEQQAGKRVVVDRG
jgi:hypothetical protein